MSNFWSKSPSSRIYVEQVLAYLGGAATVVSTTFKPGTQQIRVCSEVQGFYTVGSSTTITIGSNGTKLPANWVDFATVTSGQLCAFNSTSTGTGLVSVTEMA